MKFLALFLIFSLTVAAATVTPLFAEDVPDDSGNEYYQQGMQLRAEGRLGEAEDAFQKAAQAEPNNPDYHFELSNLYVARYDTWKDSASSLQARNLLLQAQHELEQTVTYRPDYLAARFNLGVVLKREGKYEAAREEFKRVLKLSPGLAAAWYQIGSTYQEQGFWDDAEDAYRKAKELNASPEFDEALEDLQRARVMAQERSEKISALGGLGQTEMFNSSNNPYDGGFNQNQNNSNGSSMQSAMPSLAAMMIQQFLSKRSQSNNQ